MSKREKSPAYSYGWIRAEVIGALINGYLPHTLRRSVLIVVAGVFLISVCLFIMLEALNRFIDASSTFPPFLSSFSLLLSDPHSLAAEVTLPYLIVAVAGGGLLMNIVGLVMFSGHASVGHSHSHGHGHSHGGGHGHSHSHKKKKQKKTPADETCVYCHHRHCSCTRVSYASPTHVSRVHLLPHVCSNASSDCLLTHACSQTFSHASSLLTLVLLHLGLLPRSPRPVPPPPTSCSRRTGVTSLPARSLSAHQMCWM